ncbi:hypothetical protein JT31_21810 [Cedecea neteri]|uniref:Uncharacterized protein n=1 Tax=Cedecea neteri TaxID=158822 RepID=A0A089Q9H1_9ENTR|nr:hypothetical protein [Cedecea neteri]AIR07149.1 hypothetical protein JT31_21810 [Cedecea neteri]
MTPRQRRAQKTAFERAAAAPRKSYLGRFTPLSDIQSGWIKSLLTTWGEIVGGKTTAQYRLENCNRLVSSAKDEGWSDGQLSRITEALKQAKKEGFKGHQAVARAHTILWSISLSEMMEQTGRRDDADCIEQAALQAFKIDDPVYIVGVRYYTTRTKIADITRELQLVAPWLTDGEGRKRVRWCLEIFRARIFLAVKRGEGKS